MIIKKSRNGYINVFERATATVVTTTTKRQQRLHEGVAVKTAAN